VRYDYHPEHPESACYTAQVAEMPGLILGGRTPEAAVSECRAELADTIVWFNEEGWTLPEPGSRPPDRDPDALAEPLVKIPARVKSAAATLGRQKRSQGGLLAAKPLKSPCDGQAWRTAQRQQKQKGPSRRLTAPTAQRVGHGLFHPMLAVQ